MGVVMEKVSYKVRQWWGGSGGEQQRPRGEERGSCGPPVLLRYGPDRAPTSRRGNLPPSHAIAVGCDLPRDEDRPSPTSRSHVHGVVQDFGLPGDPGNGPPDPPGRLRARSPSSRGPVAGADPGGPDVRR